ncbi:MAG: response regulator [Cyanobacteriota bacterium]
MSKIKNITLVYLVLMIIIVNYNLNTIIEFLLQYLIIYLFHLNLILIEKFDSSIKNNYYRKYFIIASGIVFLFLSNDFFNYLNKINAKNSFSPWLTLIFIFSLIYLLFFRKKKLSNENFENYPENNQEIKESSNQIILENIKEELTEKLDSIIDKKLDIISQEEIVSNIEKIAKIENDRIDKLKSDKILKEYKEGEFKVLIVDDDLINIKILSSYLFSENYKVTQALNGEEALKCLGNGFKPDIIILDIMMPNMSGYEVCEKIRETYPLYELPIVLLTGKNEISDLVKGFDSGANDYLTKPVAKRELISRIKTHIELSKINLSYGKFVPREFLKFLGRESIIDVKLGDQIQLNMSVMFSDIRSFTSLSETMTPKENFNFLNSYLSKVSPVIRKNNGFIDKYIGDGMMALFPKDADDAIDSALEILAELKILNKKRKEKNLEEITIGIGIHTGSLMLGTIGEDERMETTVISDAVNLSSRMEGLTKAYAASIIISEQTLNELKNKEKYKYRFLGKVQVKGKHKYVSIFEIYDIHNNDLLDLRNKTENYFNEAIKSYYNKEFSKSIYFFEKVLEINSNDKIAYFYINKIEELERIGISENWTGVEKANEK